MCFFLFCACVWCGLRRFDYFGFCVDGGVCWFKFCGLLALLGCFACTVVILRGLVYLNGLCALCVLRVCGLRVLCLDVAFCVMICVSLIAAGYVVWYGMFGCLILCLLCFVDFACGLCVLILVFA